MILNPGNGLISGTATTVGTSNVSISASNAGGTGSAVLRIAVLPLPPVISSALSATGTSGIGFSYRISASNSPTGYGASGLPAGLSVNTGNGLISGTTQATGTSNVIISGSNAGGVGSATLVLTINPLIPVITSGTSVTAAEGNPFSYQITAINSPGSYGAIGLPAGFTVNQQTGLISGTWTATGTNTITVTASNAGGTGSEPVSVLVETPYALWQSEVFPSSNLAIPSITGDTATPAGDGIPNLLKYALDLNPMTDGEGGLPVESIATITNISSGGNSEGTYKYLALTYTQVLSATDITYTVQVSNDLKTWNSGTGYTMPPVATPNGDGITETVTVRAATPINGTQFIRLQVTGP